MGAKRVNGDTAKKLVERGAVLVDVRNPISFRNGTITGAINMPVRIVHNLIPYNKKTKFVFFGENENDPDLKTILNYATQFFEHVYFLSNKDEWK